MSHYPNDWTSQSVGDCISVLSLPGKPKLPTTAYKVSGRFPIIDQGQGFIAGWTDDPAGVIATDLPVIVFGDHTRAIKYLDRPFVRGADGTQVLKPRADIDPLFLYYACRSIDVPSRGYNRHFSVFKGLGIAVPSEPTEQKRIGKVMRAVESALTWQASLADTTLSLKRATMRELFARGLRGEVQQDTDLGAFPRNWKCVPISELGKVVTGTTPATKSKEYYSDAHIPFIAPGDFDHGNEIRCTHKHISPAGLSVSRPVPKETTCVVCIGSSIGKVGITTSLISATNQQINAVVPMDAYEARYVFHLLTFFGDHIRAQASPSPVPILSKGAFEQVVVYTSTDRVEQMEIASLLDAICQKIDFHRRKKAVLEELFRLLMHKLMTGEIRVSDLELSALPALEEARP